MADIGIGATANLSSDSTKGILQLITRHVKYVISYQDKVDEFEDKLKTLVAKRESVRQEVEVAKNNGEKIKADVELWCERVDTKIEEEEKKVKEMEAKAKSKCFNGLCPNIKSRYKLSRDAEDASSAFDALLEQCQFKGSVAYLEVPQGLVDSPPKDFVVFESRHGVFNDVMEALKDGKISMIGVFGKAGVGKTTLVNEVKRQAQKAKLFDWVVKADVTQCPDIEKIQDQIGESLGLNLTEKSIAARKSRLYHRLKNDQKKILVVLDDIQKRLDLDEVGIPYGDQHKGCKILLISRNQNVVANAMDAEKTFGIDGLEEYEAWELFKKIVGDTVESDELRTIATEVVKKCAGLPAVITRVARELRNKQVCVWKDALSNKQVFAASDQ